MGAYRLLGCRGCGSVIVEAALRLADIPYDYEEVDYATPGPGRDRLFALNSLGQVPTLILPDGGVMTESAAIIMAIDDAAPAAALVPEPGSAERNAFLRWLFVFVAAIYPTYTYGDDPKKWLPGSSDAPLLRGSTDKHREKLWSDIEGTVAPQPWFMGTRFSALDLYVGAMTHWRPGQDWFAAACPKLASIGAEVERLPILTPLFRANFNGNAA